MRLGTPSKINGFWHVPVECEASGKFITREPDGVTSFPIYYSVISSDIVGTDILLFLKVKGDEWGYDKRKQISIKLPKSTAVGEYSVYYLDRNSTKHFIQKLTLANTAEKL